MAGPNAAPAQDGLDLVAAVEEQPGTDPGLTVRANEVHGPVSGRDVDEDAVHGSSLQLPVLLGVEAHGGAASPVLHAVFECLAVSQIFQPIAALEHIEQGVIAGKGTHPAHACRQVSFKEGALPSQVGAQVEIRRKFCGVAEARALAKFRRKQDEGIYGKCKGK